MQVSKLVKFYGYFYEIFGQIVDLTNVHTCEIFKIILRTVPHHTYNLLKKSPEFSEYSKVQYRTDYRTMHYGYVRVC